MKDKGMLNRVTTMAADALATLGDHAIKLVLKYSSHSTKLIDVTIGYTTGPHFTK